MGADCVHDLDEYIYVPRSMRFLRRIQMFTFITDRSCSFRGYIAGLKWKGMEWSEKEWNGVGTSGLLYAEAERNGMEWEIVGMNGTEWEGVE